MRYISIVVILALFSFFGCDNTSNDTDKIQAEQTEKLISEAQKQVGMPNIHNFQQRKLMKMVYELCDKEDLVCYAYIKSDYHGKLFFIGKCIGFGIPYSAQYTNPEKIAIKSHDVGVLSLPQPDPNGLYMPTASSATWLMMINPDTKEIHPVYLEPEIVVSPFPLHLSKEKITNKK